MTRVVKSDSEKLDNVLIETAKGKEFTVAEIKHSNRIKNIANNKIINQNYLKILKQLEKQKK